jgi:hypothetical protein
VYLTRSAHWLTGQLYQMPPTQLPTCEPQNARFWKSHGKLLKSSPSPKRPTLMSELLVEEFLLVPHLRQARGLATAPDFLGRSEAADAWIVDPVVADVVAAALGDGQLEFGVVPAEDLLQVQVRAQANWSL